MSDLDPRDAAFRRMYVLMNKMVTNHGFSPEEARKLIKRELQREYDQRIGLRRSTFRVVGSEMQR
jgi:hypothetical protein